MSYSFLQCFSLVMSRCSDMAIPPCWIVCLLHGQHVSLLLMITMTIHSSIPLCSSSSSSSPRDFARSPLAAHRPQPRSPTTRSAISTTRSTVSCGRNGILRTRSSIWAERITSADRRRWWMMMGGKCRGRGGTSECGVPRRLGRDEGRGVGVGHRG